MKKMKINIHVEANKTGSWNLPLAEEIVWP